MSEDRTLLIFAEVRVLPAFESREAEVFLESRVLHIQDDERNLEVYLP